MEATIDEKEDKRNGFAKKLRRGGRGITLKYDGECTDCGAFLAKGTTARWYGRGRIYGYTCHSNEGKVGVVGEKPKPAQNELDFDPAEINPREGDDSKGYDCTIH